MTPPRMTTRTPGMSRSKSTAIGFLIGVWIGVLADLLLLVFFYVSPFFLGVACSFLAVLIVYKLASEPTPSASSRRRETRRRLSLSVSKRRTRVRPPLSSLSPPPSFSPLSPPLSSSSPPPSPPLHGLTSKGGEWYPSPDEVPYEWSVSVRKGRARAWTEC